MKTLKVWAEEGPPKVARCDELNPYNPCRSLGALAAEDRTADPCAAPPARRAHGNDAGMGTGMDRGGRVFRAQLVLRYTIRAPAEA